MARIPCIILLVGCLAACGTDVSPGIPNGGDTARGDSAAGDPGPNGDTSSSGDTASNGDTNAGDPGPGDTAMGDMDMGDMDMGDADMGDADMGGDAIVASCNPDFGIGDACGGDVEGTWNFSDVCTDFEVDLGSVCDSDVQILDQSVSGSGTLTFAAGMVTRDVDLTLSVMFRLPQSCLMGNCSSVAAGIQSAYPEASVLCGPNVPTGGCDCSVDVDTSTNETAGYTLSSGQTILVDGGDKYRYCVAGDTLTVREFGVGATEDDFVQVYTAE